MITGDLGAIGGQLPWADESIKVAFGIENRRDKVENTTDFLRTTAVLGGPGGRNDRHQRLHQRERLLHGSEHSAGAGQDRPQQLSVDPRIATPTTTPASDGHLQVRRDWAPVKTSGSEEATSVRSARRTSSSSSQRRDSTCSISTAIRAAQMIRIRMRRQRGSASRPVCQPVCSLSRTGQSGGPVQFQSGRQHGAGAGRVGHDLLWPGVHSALCARPERVDRLLRHRGRQL